MGTRQRFEGRRLDDLLAEVRATAGEDAVIVEANRRRRGGLFGFFAREVFEVVVETADEASAAAPPDAPSPGAEPTPPRSLLDLAEAVDDVPHLELSGRSSLRFDEVLAIALETGRFAGGPNPSTGPVAQPAEPEPGVPTPDLTPRPLTLVRGQVEVDRHLVALGLPRRLCPPPSHPDLLATRLAQRLGELPAPPPVPAGVPGVIVAVVGTPDRALATARRLADDLGGAAQLLLASPDAPAARVALIGDADEAVARRLGWRRRARPTIVAVDAPVSPRRAGWAAGLLVALAPAVTWGAVPAATKPEDLAAWLDALGGLDALAVDGLDDTTTPASVLQAGVPVVRLDGRPATPLHWAALLLDRIDTALVAEGVAA